MECSMSATSTTVFQRACGVTDEQCAESKHGMATDLKTERKTKEQYRLLIDSQAVCS